MSTTISYRQLDAAIDYKSISVDTTLDACDSGKTILLDAIGEAITLPAPIQGVNYKFLATATTATSNWVITATGALIYGSIELAGAVEAASAETSINLVIAKFLPGDYINLESDGTNWYISGSVVTALGVVFA